MEILQRAPLALKKANPFWFAAIAFIIASSFLMADMTSKAIKWKMMVPEYSSPEKTVSRTRSPKKPRKSLLDLVSQPSKSSTISTRRDIPFLTQYKLIGTAVRKSGGSYAVFENTSRRDQIFLKEGEITDNNVLVKRVDPGKVTLLSDGAEYNMEITYKSKENKTTASISRPSPTSNAVSSNLSTTLNKREVDDTLKDMNKVMTQARIIPYIVNNKNQGYRIFSIRPNSIYTKIGLKNGDVIQRVNGIELASPEKAYSLFQQLKDEPKVSLDILRRGQKSTLDISIR
jgi:general secretion pathway protein C